MATDILLSVAIPTRNRQKYLTCLVEKMLEEADDRFEIVIQDNSDDDRLRSFVAGLNDPRVRYDYVAGWMSVVDNCDKVIAACRGTYICMLGDDDGILLAESLVALAKARDDGADALMSSILHYVWPGLEHHLISDYGGKVYKKPVKTVERAPDLAHALGSVLHHGGALGLEGLPCVYHGFVSKRALDEVFARSGSYFPGPSPDMANAAALSQVLLASAFSVRPLVIAGHSASSTAGAGTQRKHHGAIAEQPHLPMDTVDTWYPEIPFFWSGPTIYSQSLRRALARMGKHVPVSQGMACLYAACLVYHRDRLSEINNAMKAAKSSRLVLTVQIICHILGIMARRARNLVHNLANRINLSGDEAQPAETIGDAIQIAQAWGRASHD